MWLEMMEEGRELMLAGIRIQYPELNKNEVRFELLMRVRKFDASLTWIDR